LREGLKKCEDAIKELEVNSTTIEIQVNELFNNIRIKLDEKQQELLNKLEEIEKFKKKELELQIEELKFGIESITGSCQMIENSIILSNQNKNETQLLTMKKLYESRLDYLSNNIWKIEPCHHSLIELLINENEKESIYSSISNIGMINSNEISPERSLISRNDKQRIYENREYKFKIIGYSKEGNEMKIGGNGKNFKIRIEDESNNEEKKHESKIIDLNDGSYQVKIKLKDEGNYLIFAQYDGIDICSSPFEIQVLSKPRNCNEINQPILTFGFKGNGNGNGRFQNPFGITINSKGNIFVCDSGNHRIQIFNPEGNFISTFGSKGNRNGQFNHPIGIIIDSKGNIIVSDQKNYRIQIFDSNGNFISTFGSHGDKIGQFKFPGGICVDKNDNIYVCDSWNNRIQIFDFQGKFISTFGLKGNENDQFHNPVGITFNSIGNILVSDNYNNRIQTFNSTFGTKGNGNGEFRSPRGICVDLNDNIYICDSINDRIQIFNPEGKYMTQLKVNYPKDIAIDPKTQNIVVCGEDGISIFLARLQ